MPSEGHYRPLLPLAYALAARGHELAFAVAPAWELRVTEDGFATLAAGISDEEGRERAAPERREIFALGAEGRRPQLFTLMFAKIHAPAKVDELLDVARRWGAEVIVHDSSDLAAPIVAASLGIPSVNHSFGAMVPFAVLERAAVELEPIRARLGLEPDPTRAPFAASSSISPRRPSRGSNRSAGASACDRFPPRKGRRRHGWTSSSRRSSTSRSAPSSTTRRASVRCSPA